MTTTGTGLSRFATRSVRRHLVGPRQQWAFEPPPSGWSPPRLERTSLYLHVPFCTNECPYCPYTKVRYDPALIARYEAAARAEVDLWAGAVGPSEVTSLYIGGGTPTLVTATVLRIVDHMRSRFLFTGDVCIETSPTAISQATVEMLREAGVDQVSLGVQSFHERELDVVGRRYAPARARDALDRLASAGFASVNVDIMFALPGQSTSDLIADLDEAAARGADQITTYPLFTFPYTPVGRYLKDVGVGLPDLAARHEQYRAICAWARANGYERVSVWGFRRGDVPRYSSVTRDGYVGIGPGSGSHLPDGFVLNTFDLEQWESAVEAGRLPVALRMPFTPEMSAWWWLYWRFYDTRIPAAPLDITLGADAGKAHRWLGAMKATGLARRENGSYELTDAGAFWLHLAQNHFALSYVNTLWTAARRTPWPARVEI